VRVYVNREEIFAWAEKHVARRRPFVTVFEGAATSDPLPLEPWGHAMKEAIEHFGQHPYGRFRFVTKYDQVDSLLHLDHRRHTRIRFTLNTERIVKQWDKATASLQRRLLAARKVAEAGYPYGFLIGPIVAYEGWEREYEELISHIRDTLPANTYELASFELVTHRFTPRAKAQIETVYPRTDLPMDEEQREWRHGQFGYGKWVYPKAIYEKARQLFYGTIPKQFPGAAIMYLV
jgi:spore photoproduct lyase